jgi:hypothetical protein
MNTRRHVADDRDINDALQGLAASAIKIHHEAVLCIESRKNIGTVQCLVLTTVQGGTWHVHSRPQLHDFSEVSFVQTTHWTFLSSG